MSNSTKMVEVNGIKVPQKAVDADGNLVWKNIDTEVEHQGSKITLPALPGNMPVDDAIAALQRKKADDERFIDVVEAVDAYPLDGAVAFMIAMKTKYGWASPVPTPGFFPKPPRMITVDVGPGPLEKIQVPWGSFQIPGIEKPVTTDLTHGEHGPCFVVYGSLRKKEVHLLKELADLTRAIVKDHSIYKGKAIRLRTNDEGDMSVEQPPTFIDTSGVKPDEVIMSRDVLDLVETNIYTIIKRTEECRKAGIPLKRGILLEGPYGCGKSLTATVTAKHAEDHGWTFLLLDRCQALTTALEFARRYQPCVIFAEDIDRMTEERDEQANDLLNTLDGALSKDAQIMVVLTTNHVEKINKAMLRPGRFDAVISVSPPDADAAQKLIRMYARGSLKDGVKLGEIGEMIAGTTPAVIREVVERSKLAMISRGAKTLIEADLIVSATGMEHHRRLLAEKPKTDPTAAEKIAQGLVSVLQEALGTTPDAVDETKNRVVNLQATANGVSRTASTILHKQIESEPTISETNEKVKKIAKAVNAG